MNQYDADGATMGFRNSEDLRDYLETAQKQATSNNQTNDLPYGNRQELIRTFRQLLEDACEHACQGSTESADKLIEAAIEKYADLLETDAQRPAMKPLTDEQMLGLWSSQGDDTMEKQAAITFARVIEAAHGIK